MCYPQKSVASDFIPIFEQEYRLLRPRAPMPPIHIRFRRFTSLNTTIRLREGHIFVSLSDLLEGAPESVIRAIAHILLAKLYRKPVDVAHNVVSRVFDRPSSPRYAIEYLLFHEMLHLKHPVRMRGLRRCVHSREFKAEEQQFPRLKEALAFIKRL